MSDCHNNIGSRDETSSNTDHTQQTLQNSFSFSQNDANLSDATVIDITNIASGYRGLDPQVRKRNMEDTGKLLTAADTGLTQVVETENTTVGAYLQPHRPLKKRNTTMIPYSAITSTNTSVSDDSALVAVADDTQQLPLPSPSASPIPDDENQMDLEGEEGTKNVPQGYRHLISLPKCENDLIDMIAKLVELLPENADYKKRLIWRMLQQTDRPTLSLFNNAIKESLKCDFIAGLPFEITAKIIRRLDHTSLCRGSAVSSKWNSLFTETMDFWKPLAIRERLFADEESFDADCMILRQRFIATFGYEPNSNELSKMAYKRRLVILRRWMDPNYQPKRIAIEGHGQNVVTCLQFDGNKVITSADDKMINLYDVKTGEEKTQFKGHEGGVWAMKYIGNTLVSGSTDRSVRIWNIKTGRCTHVFHGHTSTVRCVEILMPVQIGVSDMGEPVMFPPVPYLATGSRDTTLQIWKLPLADEKDDTDPSVPPIDSDGNEDEFLVMTLNGHTGSIRSISGYGNIAITGSYDTTIRVWDLQRKCCKFILRGHTDRIYSVILDVKRNRCISGSIDSTVRVWNLTTGELISILHGHQSLVGLINLTENSLVSAGADSSLRIWDTETGTTRHLLKGHGGPITCFTNDDNLIVSGSDKMLKLWNVRTGEFIRDLANDENTGQIWQVKTDYRRCAVSLQKDDNTFVEVLDFGFPEPDVFENRFQAIDNGLNGVSATSTGIEDQIMSDEW
ncbi:unnamed protein product [Kuraishia capsulata CBS 1993]|uniref:F-box domain-containing protein n=1 Tax=Kuraishia capsulata CBS 1993 TaxID=1382522 RepID=W6MI83_9ASCO|nr:uncharacterized protein KUCA_T00001568001 [Kuraishia capsulata CBS 1993]CDK25598.1 unnamed protein product [Kuraishia capsulata CBS 1993]